MSPQASAIVALVVCALLFCVSYYISLRVHPNRNCPACGGGGKHRGVLFTHAHRQCTRCDGTGRQPRLGTVLLTKWRGR